MRKPVAPGYVLHDPFRGLFWSAKTPDGTTRSIHIATRVAPNEAHGSRWDLCRIIVDGDAYSLEEV